MFKRTEKGFYYLHTYYPKRYVEEHKGVSESILDFKYGNPKAIDLFANEFEKALIHEVEGATFRLSEKFIVIVPSHKKDNWSKSMMIIACELCKRLGMRNYSQALIRTADHEKLAWGGDRSVGSHLGTIQVDSDFNIEGKEILLLDDVVTTGNSILACLEILKNANPTRIAVAVIGKTY
jgi:predicted amidophosphoribosyltransferase